MAVSQSSSMKHVYLVRIQSKYPCDNVLKERRGKDKTQKAVSFLRQTLYNMTGRDGRMSSALDPSVSSRRIQMLGGLNPSRVKQMTL